MMTTKHTQGPWIAKGGQVIAPHQKLDGLEYNVAECSDVDSPLIAAAPDLLAALEYCANVMEFYAQNPKLAVSDPLKQARAAIAKAKGEQA